MYSKYEYLSCVRIYWQGAVSRKEKGLAPLHIATMQQNIKMVRLLLDRGETLLQWIPALRLLLITYRFTTVGALIYRVNLQQATAAHVSCKYESGTQMICLFLEKGRKIFISTRLDSIFTYCVPFLFVQDSILYAPTWTNKPSFIMQLETTMLLSSRWY